MLILLFTLSSSCSDQGCIDADDFGEYESETLTVSANPSQGDCSYDPSKSLDDQGGGLRKCPDGAPSCYHLTAGNVSLDDGVGNVQSAPIPANSGCKGFANRSLQSLCISNVIQNCLNNAGAGASSSEPRWVSTSGKVAGKNIGVTIKPGSKIFIRAVGNVKLGDSSSSPNFYVKADTPIPHSNNSSWNNNFFDVRSGQTLDLKFSGKWSDGTNTLGAGNSATAPTSELLNGARRIVAFLIPHPPGYEFNVAASTEVSGSKGVPLLPDRSTWKCIYDGSPNPLCTTGSYTLLGYSGINDLLTSTTFPISSNYRTPTLTQYGGMIRWNGDGLEPNNLRSSLRANTDPFNGISCDNNGICAGAENVLSSRGMLLTGLANSSDTDPFIITTPTPDAYKISFKSLSSSCLVNLTVTINNGTEDLYSEMVGSVNTPEKIILVNHLGWSARHITLEPGQKLIIKQNTAKYGPNNISCDHVIAARFNKYHDLKMDVSGFVEFKILDGTSSSCKIKARIINPTGRSTNLNSNFTADFYEYDDFMSTDPSLGTAARTSTDPLANLDVATDSWTNAASPAKNIFVRKGQVIRFSPESWDGAFLGGPGYPTECGIGMAMHITQRPALLCRGMADDLVQNMDCAPEYKDGVLIGCRTDAAVCNKEDSGAYCANSCRKKIDCTAGTESNQYTKTCTISSSREGNCKEACTPEETKAGTCVTFPISATDGNGVVHPPLYTSASCDICATAMLAKGNTPAKIVVNNLSQCYDLENYTGKVSNIPLATGFTIAQLADASFSKGAVKLGSFNDFYGNFESFSNLGANEIDPPSNKIFQLKIPITFSRSGRLRFFILDGDGSFIDTSTSGYSNNSSSGTGYTGSNGFKISASSMLEFSNGQWLQAILCRESSATSDICSSTGTTVPEQISGQPSIVRINVPTGAIGSPIFSGNYKFDDYGSIQRRDVSFTGENYCTSTGQGMVAEPGSNFYCHTKKYHTANEIKNKKLIGGDPLDIDAMNAEISKFRITFKILDPEIPNCVIGSGSGTFSGIKLKNPFYESSNALNSGLTCDATEVPADPPSGGKTKCVKEFYCGNKYLNNSGQYYVNVKVKSPGSGATSNIIGGVITPIIEVMDGKKDRSTIGQTERMYKLLISDQRYKTILNLSLVMMFTFYGFGYLMGMSEANATETLQRIIKIGLIYLFVGEAGWKFFNEIIVQFFKGGTDFLAFMMASSFDNSAEVSQAIANSDYYDKSILFSSIDKVFGMFFSQAVQKKIAALLFASIFGWAYLLIIYNSFMLYVYAVANAVLIYLTAQIFLSILFTLGPIFFLFTLFQTTKGMFDNWLKQLIGFSLQQIFLLTTLSFFNMMMYEVIKMSLGYKICWDEVWTINIYITRVTLLSFWTIASLPPRTNAQSDVGNIGNPDGIPSLFSILFIWVIASLMNKFIGFMSDLAATIGGGIKATAVAKGFKEAATAMKNAAAKSDLGKKASQYIAQAGARVDQKLFDHGELADKARNAIKAKNTEISNQKSALAKAGNDEVKRFKKENAGSLVGQSKSKQQEILNKARDEAMNRKGAELGLSTKEIEKLKNDKGLKYVGNNVFIAAAMAAKQSVSQGGSLRTSLGERDAKTKFSSGDAKDAMKNLTPDARRAFLASVKKGEIEVGKSKTAMARDAGSTTLKGLKSAGSATVSGVKSVGKATLAAPKKAWGGIKSATSSIVGGAKAINKSRKNKTMLKDLDNLTIKAVGKLSNNYETAQKLRAAKAKVGDAVGGALEKLNNTEYRKAAHQLESEGAVTKMAGGALGNALRSDREKKAIRDRVRANAAAKKTTIAGAANEDAVAELEMESAYLEEAEKINPDSNAVSKAAKGLAARIKTKGVTGLASKSSRAKAKAESKQSAKEGVGKEIEEVDKDIAATEERENAAREERKGIEEMPEYQEMKADLEQSPARLKKLEADKKKTKPLSKERSKANEAINAEKERAQSLAKGLLKKTLAADTSINKEKSAGSVLREKRTALEKVRDSLHEDDSPPPAHTSTTPVTATPTDAASAGTPLATAAAAPTAAKTGLDPNEEGTEVVEEKADKAEVGLNPLEEGVEFNPEEVIPAADSSPKMRMQTNPMFKHKLPEET